MLIALQLVLAGFFFVRMIRLLREKRAPYQPSFAKDLALMQRHLDLQPGATIVDLGCGDGAALRMFAKTFGVKQAVGYDDDRRPLAVGAVLNRVHRVKVVDLRKGDLRSAPLAQFDAIYVYLLPDDVASIEDRIFVTKKPEAVVIANTFAFPTRAPARVVSDSRGRARIFVYV